MKKRKKLKLYLIIADENLFHPHFLKQLMQTFSERGYKLQGITIARDSYKKGFLYAIYSQYKLWGFLGFSFISINVLVRLILLRIGLDNKHTIQGIASKYQIKIIHSKNVNDKEHIEYLSQLNIDIIISSNGQIFRKELLRVPRVGSINRHSSLLPEYGGVLPVFWAMKNMEKNIGVSVHIMVEKIDRGDILFYQKFKNTKNKSLFYNYIVAFDISAYVTSMAIENLLLKKIVKKFKHNKKEYFSFPNDRSIKEFKKKNKAFSVSDIFSYYRYYAS